MQNTADTRSEQADPVVIPLPNGAEQNDVEQNKPVLDWLIQANSAGIFRYAGLMAWRLGIKVGAVVHDALLIEAPADRIEEEVARATRCLERASRMFLHELMLRVDAKIIREGERFADKRGTKIWNYVERTLQELPREARDVA